MLQSARVEEVVGCIYAHGIIILLWLSGAAIVHCGHTAIVAGSLEHLCGWRRLSVLVRWMGPPATTRRGVERRLHQHLPLLLLMDDIWIRPICTALTLLLMLVLLLHHLAGSPNATGTQECLETTSQLIVSKGVFRANSNPTGGIVPGRRRGRSLTVIGAVDVLDGIGPGPGRGGMRVRIMSTVVGGAATAAAAVIATTVIVPRSPTPLLVIGGRSRRGLSRFVPAHGPRRSDGEATI